MLQDVVCSPRNYSAWLRRYESILRCQFDDPLNLSAIDVEFTSYCALAVTRVVPGSDRLVHGRR